MSAACAAIPSRDDDPHTAVERRLVSACTSWLDEYAAVRELVDPSDIADLRARIVFEAIGRERDRIRGVDGAVDFVLLSRCLEERDELVAVGGAAGLTDFQSLEAVSSWTLRLAREVRAASLDREVRRLARHLAQSGVDESLADELSARLAELKSFKLREEKSLSTTVLADVEAAAIRWVWRGRIPLGKLTTLDGDPGVGKSTLLADLVARVTTGAAMPDDSPGILGNVVILCAEDDPDDTIRPRLEAAGADLSKVFIVDIENHLPSVVDQADELVATLRKRDARLLIVDPFATFTGRKTKIESTNSTSDSMFKIKRAAREARCAVVLVRHLNKDTKQGKAIYRGTNSISIIGTVRAGLIAGTDPEDPTRCVLAVSKANLASKDETRSLGYRIVTAAGPAGPTSRVEWLGEVDWHSDEIVGVVNPGRETARETAVDWLRSTLAAGPMLATELELAATAAKHSMRTIKRAKDEAGVESRRRFDQRWEWQIREKAS